jgi:hypothetical protein
MDERASARLRVLGIVTLVICGTLLLLPHILATDIKYDDAIAGTLAIGIGLLLLAEIAPLVKSFKAGGVEVEFLDTVSGKFNALDARIAKLEIAAQSGVPQTKELMASAPVRARPPGLSTPPAHRDDPQWGRFGGASEREGFVLRAFFQNATKNFVEVVMIVDAPPGLVPDSEDVIEFYLHDTFDPDVVPAVFTEGKAELRVIAYGGFTVGAWIAHRGLSLELDLSKVRGAPRMIREL